MLLIYDGVNKMVSGTYPMPYSIFSKIRFFEAERRTLTSLFLIIVEIIFCVLFLYLIIKQKEPSAASAFSIGFPSLLIGLKFAMQKKIDVRREDIVILGPAPARIWIEHVLLCLVLGLSALWANVMQKFPLFAPTAYTGIFFIAFASSIWPYMNYLIYKLTVDKANN